MNLSCAIKSKVTGNESLMKRKMYLHVVALRLILKKCKRNLLLARNLKTFTEND